MAEKFKTLLMRYFKWSVLSAIVGLFGGVAAAIFLTLLALATDFRTQHPDLIWYLPLAGLGIGLAYHFLGRTVEGGTGLILEEVHRPKTIIPFRMAPLVLFGTVTTHLFGGSAGREGTAVQMGASLADQLSKFLKIDKEERRILLVAGAGAGFSAAIGAPFAGTLFGLEVVQIGKLRVFALFECFVASFIAYYTCRALGAPHTQYPEVTLPGYEFRYFVAVAFAGIAFGLAANIFMKFTHGVELTQKKIFKYAPWRPFFAGILLVILYHWEGSLRYAGLGIPVILDSFSAPSDWLDPVFKAGFTALTIGSGFKGGEFIPLVFIGTTLGSALSTLLSVPTGLMAALGFAAVFGAAANTPISCAIMAMELFGWELAPFALMSCWVAYHFTGHLGVYKNQKVARSKKDQLLLVFQWKNLFQRRGKNSEAAGHKKEKSQR
jgi:H+/Cl- antiporter ClcA